jgi:hypothetical protein
MIVLNGPFKPHSRPHYFGQLSDLLILPHPDIDDLSYFFIIAFFYQKHARVRQVIHMQKLSIGLAGAPKRDNYVISG